jgi:hypothetical protein
MVRSFFVGPRFLDIEQGSASGKALFDPVPIADSRFTLLPAQKDHFCSQQAREIDQTLFRSLADATVALYLFYAFFDFRHQLSNVTIPLQSVHKIRGLWIQMFMTYDCFALVSQSPNIFLDPFSQRTHGGQQRIGFIHRKESRKRDHTYLWLFKNGAFLRRHGAGGRKVADHC